MPRRVKNSSPSAVRPKFWPSTDRVGGISGTKSSSGPLKKRRIYPGKGLYFSYPLPQLVLGMGVRPFPILAIRHRQGDHPTRHHPFWRITPLLLAINCGRSTSNSWAKPMTRLRRGGVLKEKSSSPGVLLRSVLAGVIIKFP